MFLHFAPSENCYRINVLYFIPFFSVLQTVTFTTIKPKNNFLQTVTHLPHFFPISLIYLAIGIPDRFPERTLPCKNAAKSGDMELVDTLYVSGASAVFIWSLIPLPFNLEQNKYPKFTFDGLGVTLFWLQRAVHRLHFGFKFYKAEMHSAHESCNIHDDLPSSGRSVQAHRENKRRSTLQENPQR